MPCISIILNSPSECHILFILGWSQFFSFSSNEWFGTPLIFETILAICKSYDSFLPNVKVLISVLVLSVAAKINLESSPPLNEIPILSFLLILLLIELIKSSLNSMANYLWSILFVCEFLFSTWTFCLK